MTISTIGAASRDYATVQLWMDDCPADLITSTDQWIGHCYNDSEFSVSGAPVVDISGVTTSSTYYIELTTAPGQSFKDDASASTNPLGKYDPTKGVAFTTDYGFSGVINIDSSNVYISGIQMLNSSSTGRGIQNNSSSNIFISNCTVDSENGGTTQGTLQTSTGGFVVTNCVVINRSTSGNGAHNNFAAGEYYNCTFWAPNGSTTDEGISKNGGAANSTIVKNCAIFGWTTAMASGSYGAGTDYNATDNASLSAGSNNVTSLTASNEFEDVSSYADTDLRVKTGSAMIGAGTPDPTHTNDLDIIGQPRSLTAPTIGAWEYQSGGGGFTATGALLISDSSLSGFTSVAYAAAGAINAESPALSGSATGVVSYTAAGTLTVNDSALSAAAFMSYTATGVLTVNDSTLSAAVFMSYTASGALVVDTSTLAGSATVTTGNAGYLIVDTSIIAGVGNYTPLPPPAVQFLKNVLSNVTRPIL